MRRDQTENIINLLWAKKTDKSGSLLWLPLSVHLEDVMNVGALLWHHWLTDGQKKILFQSVKSMNNSLSAEETMQNLIKFLGYAHDIGKATPAFQIQKGFSNSPDLDKRLLERIEQAGFHGLTDLYLANPKVSHHTVAGEYLLEQMGVRKDISSIVGAHHGKPVDSEELLEKQNSYLANYYQTEKSDDPIALLWKKTQIEILSRALEKSGFQSVEELPEINETGQVLLSGLLIMADWIASNEYYFPLIPFETLHIDKPSKRCVDGWNKWYKGEPISILSNPPAEREFIDRFSFLPRSFQKQFYMEVQSITQPGIIILEAPMGSGKTEAALAASEVLMNKKELGGIYFGLPTQATSNGIFPRIEQWLERVSEEYSQKSTLKLMHGKSSLNKLQAELSAGLHIDEDGESGVYTASWFSGRKTSILSDDAVGTVDQVLLMSLKQKHLALRHLGFSKKVVIIDEVHAYDAYMNVYLSETLEWLGAYDVPVILLSATLPYDKRRDLVLSYMKGLGVKKRELHIYEELFNSSSYPIMTFSDGKTIKQKALPVIQSGLNVQVRKISENDLISILNDLLSNGGGIAGIIVNTVRKAQELYQQLSQLYEADEILLLHSRFIDTDRTTKENHLINMIGKNGERPYKLIVIGTQVLEQSLDIDFDVLFTELCPMDLLLQRVGRLHRHNIKRPEKLYDPEVFVMGTNDHLEFDKGSAAIYDASYLARTQKFLPDQICLPDDISPLVQKVYSNLEIEWPAGLKEKYNTAVRNSEDKTYRKENKAATFKIDDPKLKVNPEKYNLIGWLKTDFDTQSDETAYSQVRDSSETVEVNAVIKCRNGYAFFEHPEDDISGKIENSETAREIALHTLSISTPILYAAAGSVKDAISWLEEYNKSNLSVWQKQPWLKGSLGIIFDIDGTFKFKKVQLIYNSKTGLTYKKL